MYIYMQVPLGVLPYNENSTEGMVTILGEMCEYVPEVGGAAFPLAFGGDMLTAARARTAREVRVTSSGKGALRGLVPFAADWHARVNYMEVRK